LKPLPIKYPARYTAIKLLEGDDEIKRIVGSVDSKVIERARQYASELERIHGEKCYVVISAERYNIAHKIVSGCEEEVALPQKLTLSEKFDALTTHKFFGYIIMIAILLAIFFAIFTAGAFLSDVISNLFNALKPTVAVKSAENILWETVFGGFVAGVTLVIPFVLPFYFVLSVLEDTGYLTRIAFLLDSVMHRIGLHGKALIPIIFGYGCSVPACYSCRIMESKRDRFITAFIITLIPCTARGIVIFGLVGAFVGIHWAFLLYAINICIAFALARCAFRILPGEPVGLIMEMHPYKLPSLKTVFKKTWWRLKSLFILVFPIYIAGGAIIGIMHISGSLTYIENALSPITVGWFGLPAITSVLLIFGLVRKELIIIMPAILIGTTDLNTVFTDVQMVVLAFIAMLYAPCIATVGALKKEFGWKKSFAIVVFEIIFAIIIGGIAYRIFDLIL
jgi:ferrous iron transport protein B